jgi:hypothetical protein
MNTGAREGQAVHVPYKNKLSSLKTKQCKLACPVVFEN